MFPFALATDIISGMHRLAALKGTWTICRHCPVKRTRSSLGCFPLNSPSWWKGKLCPKSLSTSRLHGLGSPKHQLLSMTWPPFAILSRAAVHDAQAGIGVVLHSFCIMEVSGLKAVKEQDFQGLQWLNVYSWLRATKCSRYIKWKDLLCMCSERSDDENWVTFPHGLSRASVVNFFCPGAVGQNGFAVLHSCHPIMDMPLLNLTICNVAKESNGTFWFCI